MDPQGGVLLLVEVQQRPVVKATVLPLSLHPPPDLVQRGAESVILIVQVTPQMLGMALPSLVKLRQEG